ncbi:MAG: TRAP transporter TatT component family protein [Flavobacteriales bacterium]|nr:TRAP transporter TatT component family protein [Flavobacteriales bacterium]MCX7768564.1 TRAP transporter TatT component family protein [Flavobacteriales bacterium]MDW8409467.1 TRAP transporter TatT component family protein [Flavobacteriales bacterium]
MRKSIILLTATLIVQPALKAQDPLARLAELFRQRADAQKLDECIRLGEEIMAQGPQRSAAVILARAYYFKAEGEPDKEKKLELFEKGVKAGEAALMTIPAYKDGMAAKEKEENIVKKLTKEDMDALYWTAANLARYAKFAPFSKKLAVKSRVRMLWDRVMELDPDYNYGGVYRFFGGYYALVPSITGEQDPAKSREMFEKGIQSAPHYLETKVLFAEAYCTHGKVKDRELFRKLLNEVLEADVSAYPEIAPENNIAKNKARALLAQEAELFD